MPLIIKGQQHTRKKKQEVKPTPAPSQKPKKVNPFREQEKANDINNEYRFDPQKTYLVVGGKVKEISTKSKYLLDMLIIKEEN